MYIRPIDTRINEVIVQRGYFIQKQPYGGKRLEVGIWKEEGPKRSWSPIMRLLKTWLADSMPDLVFLAIPNC